MPRSNLCKPKIHPNLLTIYNALDRSKRLGNLRQEDLAKMLEIKQNTYSHHMSHYSFSWEQLNELLDYYGLEIKVCDKC